MQRPLCAIAQNRWGGISVSYGEIVAPVRTRPLWGSPGAGSLDSHFNDTGSKGKANVNPQ
jgi:hypothetical protein